MLGSAESEKVSLYLSPLVVFGMQNVHDFSDT